MINDNSTSRASFPGHDELETPCLVNCRQGVSVLYKDHYLYSKYDPSKSILNIISNLQLHSESLILIFSPVLWLGLPELIQKTSSDSKIIAFELDNNLYNFSKDKIIKEFNDKVTFFSSDDVNSYLNFIQNNHFKKVVRIDFSAGTIFNKEKYDNLFFLTQSVINQYWKNRLTLTSFGRLYSKNFFKNLRHLANTVSLKSLYNKVKKPVLVLGAGESLDYTINELKNIRNNFFILCVDAAVNSLLENNITPDGIVAVEGQLAIEKAYIGKPKNSKILLFTDLVSRSHIPQIVNGKTAYFISEFAKLDFFNKLERYELLPPLIPPLGSVGLVAMELALRLRADENIPIAVSGLDFSYSVGITHAKGTPSHKSRLLNVSKISSLDNINAAFGTGNFFIQSKDNTKMVSSKALDGYKQLFTESFSSKKNVYDCGKKGSNLGLQLIDLTSFASYPADSFSFNLNETAFTDENICKFLKDEKTSLEILKDLLSNGDNSQYRSADISLMQQINAILKEKEYLYIHFPDAEGKTNIQSFLNRIRIEIDFFLKEINLSLN